MIISRYFIRKLKTAISKMRLYKFNGVALFSHPLETIDIHETHDLNWEILGKTRGFMKTPGFRPSPSVLSCYQNCNLLPFVLLGKLGDSWKPQVSAPLLFNWPSTPQFGQPSKFAPAGRAPRAQWKRRKELGNKGWTNFSVSPSVTL